MRRCDQKQKREYERQYRVIDQMLTMHSLYRDILGRRAFWLNTTLVALSLFLAVFSFIEDGMLRMLGWEPEIARFVFSASAVSILVVAITEFRVDWQSVSGRHADAGRRLAAMKALYRRYDTEDVLREDGDEEKLADEYNRLMEMIPPIPDRWFNKLKARHCYKVEVSQRISCYPKTPVWLLCVMVRMEGVWEACAGEREK